MGGGFSQSRTTSVPKTSLERPKEPHSYEDLLSMSPTPMVCESCGRRSHTSRSSYCPYNNSVKTFNDADSSYDASLNAQVDS
mmetsp:Transcript_46110/g.87973  ORF Transcript_46110/g.87973 Transcript_46110/m.87973 type:complete len:82 (-) Transcript_46110:340-585(-)